ncbi:MAG: EamA family transporter RarD [Magnetospirillum sp.]
MSESRAGALAALGAFLCWGVFGIYFKALSHVPAPEVLAHRILGGAVFALLFQVVWGRLSEIKAALSDAKVRRGLMLSSLAIGINWGFFIWAVANGRALEASLGYFIFPLVSVALARLVLKETLTPRQMVAVACAGLGVGWMVVGGGGVPWMALILAFSFGAYGLLRKTIVVGAMAGLFVEAVLLAPLALIYLLWKGADGVIPAGDSATIALILVAGPLTAIPLALFAYGARRLKLSTLGLMMYINPTLQMLVAVFVFGESFTWAHGIAFGAIWLGLAIYSWPVRRL